ncbi:hypothetical protein Tco_0765193 [Tanacetum coccineum]
MEGKEVLFEFSSKEKNVDVVFPLSPRLLVILLISLSYSYGHLKPLQVSLAEHKRREEQASRENVELVNEHLASIEIIKMVEGLENVIDDSSIPRNDDQNIFGKRLEPRSDKESPVVEITNDEERREKGKIVEESRSTPFPTPIRSPRIHTDLVSSDTEKLQELTEVMVKSLPTMVDTHIKEHVETQVPEQVKV